MEFQVLGPLQVLQDNRIVEVGTAPKLRLMLAVLLSHADRPVSVSTLTSVLWDENPPPSARKNIQLYAHQLRQTLGADFLVNQGGDYSVLAGEGLDATLFTRLAAEGGSLLEADDAAEAYHRLSAALRLWRGAALTGFLEYPSVAAEAVHLEHLRLTALEQRAEAGLATGRDAELVIELTEMLETNPYRERLRAHLMLALYRSGRQAEAFELFRHTRALLNDALGVEPGPALQRLHQAMLRGDQELVPAQRTPIRIRRMDDPCPYKGPAMFQPEDRDLFFGRDQLTSALEKSESRVAGRRARAMAVLTAAFALLLIWRRSAVRSPSTNGRTHTGSS